MRKKKSPIITEKHSPVFNRLFYWYAVTLFRRRFKRVWVDISDRPSARESTVYIGNHNSWWDALIPLLLNERIFHQQGRAMMDEKQLLKYPFFRRLGAFSVNREHPMWAMKSLEYAAFMLNNAKPGNGIGLWIYPEGQLVSPETAISLESGLAWMSRRLNPGVCDMVPFTVHMHTMRSDKPELFIKIGHAMGPGIFQAKDLLTRTTKSMEDLRRACRSESAKFHHMNDPRGGFQLMLGNLP